MIAMENCFGSNHCSESKGIIISLFVEGVVCLGGIILQKRNDFDRPILFQFIGYYQNVIGMIHYIIFSVAFCAYLAHLTPFLSPSLP